MGDSADTVAAVTTEHEMRLTWTVWVAWLLALALSAQSSRAAAASTADADRAYDKANSLLHLLASHSPLLSVKEEPRLVPVTSYSQLLVHIERVLPGSVLKLAFRSTRKAIELVSRSTRVKQIVKEKVPAVVPRRRSTRSSDRKWREDVLNFDGIVLTREEIQDGMHEVLELAQSAADAGSGNAWLMLADLHLTGYLTLEPNVTFAKFAYDKAATDHGNAEAQYMLGFLYSSNYQNAFSPQVTEGKGDQGSALLHYTFAALGGHVPAMMSVGYRYWNGIGTPQSCKDALGWYKNAADEAMRKFNTGPPGGLHLPPFKSRLSDQTGGPYGPGSSTRIVARAQTFSEWTDLIEYHLFHAQRGELATIFRLARLYYNGYAGISPSSMKDPPYGERREESVRDFRNAHRWMLKLARNVWQRDAKEAFVHPKADTKMTRRKPYYNADKDPRSKHADEHAVMVGGLAAGILGKMYLRGEGVRVDYQKAYLWFMRGSSAGDRESNNGLGIMFRDGLALERDLKRANMLFIAAAQQDLAEAQVNLGKYYFGIGEYATAKTYFDHAIRIDGIRTPETFQSYYYLAEIYALSPQAADHCPQIAAFYKATAERGDWEHSRWWDAERAYARGDVNKALLEYWIMAERGYEAAQNNVAWLLDRDKKWLKIPEVDLASSNASDRLALVYWTRSAAQDNVDSLLKMGDYYYAGVGLPDGMGATDEATTKAALEKAAAAYQSAASSRVSAMALWNLGWMHENGHGVTKDYHLAKRYYDQALETSSDAFLPATLSLCALYIRSLYYSVVHPTNDLNTLSLFETPPLSRQQGQGLTLKKAWTELKRQWGFEDPPDDDTPPTTAPPAQQDDNGQVRPTQDRTAAARRALEEDGNVMVEEELNDPWGYSYRGGEDDAEDEFAWTGDDDFGGTLAIVALCCALAFLLYVRQGQQLAAVQARAAAPQPQHQPPPRGPAADEHQMRPPPAPVPQPARLPRPAAAPVLEDGPLPTPAPTPTRTTDGDTTQAREEQNTNDSGSAAQAGEHRNGERPADKEDST